MQEENWMESYYDLINKEEKTKKQQAKLPGGKGAKNKIMQPDESKIFMPLSGSIDISDLKVITIDNFREF